MKAPAAQAVDDRALIRRPHGKSDGRGKGRTWRFDGRESTTCLNVSLRDAASLRHDHAPPAHLNVRALHPHLDPARAAHGVTLLDDHLGAVLRLAMGPQLCSE